MLLKCCTQYTSKFGKLSSGHRTGKGQFHSSPKERQCQRIFKLPHSCTHFTCQQSNNSKFFKLGFNRELSDVQAGFRKGRGTRDQFSSIRCIIEKTREFQKNFCFIDYAKAFDYVDHNKLENSERDGNTRPPYLPPEKSVCRSRSNS